MADYLQRLYNVTRKALMDGDIKAANARFKTLLDAAPSDIRTLELEGDIAMETERFQKARTAYQRLCDRTDSQEAMGIGAYSLGLVDMAVVEFDSARAHFEEAAVHFEAAQLTSRLKPVYGVLGQVTRELGDLAASADAYQRLTQIGPLEAMNNKEAYQDATLDAEGYRQFGDTLRMLGRLPAAEDALRAAQERFDMLEDDISLAAVLNGLGIVLRLQGQLEGADAYLRDALALNTAMENPDGMSDNYEQLILTCTASSDWTNAEQWTTLAWNADKEIENNDGMHLMDIYFGVIAMAQGQFTHAEKQLVEAYHYFEDCGNPEARIRSGTALAHLYLEMGLFPAASDVASRVLEQAGALGQIEFLALTNNLCAQISKAEGQIDVAQMYWSTALKHMQQLGCGAMILDIENSLSSLEIR